MEYIIWYSVQKGKEYAYKKISTILSIFLKNGSVTQVWYYTVPEKNPNWYSMLFMGCDSSLKAVNSIIFISFSKYIWSVLSM